MKVVLVSFVSEEDIMMEKEYDFDELPFVPRKGDLIEGEAFSYSSPATVEDVSINFDNDCTYVFLGKHNLVDDSYEHLEEILKGYMKKGWVRT